MDKRSLKRKGDGGRYIPPGGGTVIGIVGGILLWLLLFWLKSLV